MSVREKTSVRLDPEIVSLGRRLAKKDFGSEQKFGLLIENAIRSYHARQVQPVEASSLLSATEQALINRIEKRIEEMGKQTVNRVGNLIAKSSYETTYGTIILEQMYAKTEEKAKTNLEFFRNTAAERMKNRFDKENAERISSLMAENRELSNQYNARLAELNEQKRKTNKNGDIAEDYIAKNKSLSEKNNDLDNRLHRSLEQKKEIENWTRGLITYLGEHSTGIMKKPANKLVEEYSIQNPKPGGITS